MRSQLDGRTNAAKEFDHLVAAIENDLGGRKQLSTIELSLVEAFAGAAVTLNHLNTSFALGEPIDLAVHGQIVSAMVRIASRLGIQRRARDITELSLDAYTARADLDLTQDSSDDETAIRQPETKTRTRSRRKGKQVDASLTDGVDENSP